MRALLLLAVAAPLMAQIHFQKNYVTVGAGAGLPSGQLSGLFANAGGVGVGYGYRFQKNLQADVGFETLFGAAGVRDSLDTQIGFARIRDRQYFLPFGGRAILPLGEGRVLLSLGGGGAYLRYSERLKQLSAYYKIQCPDCSSRSGWGAYALASASYAIDHYQMFRLGVTAKAYRAHTDGGALGLVPGIETRDRWISLFANFTVSF
jgi:hypothetical protein